MRSSIAVLVTLLLPSFCATFPTKTESRVLPAPTTLSLPPTATPPPSRRNNDFQPSITPFSLDLPTVAIAEPFKPSLSLNLPPVTCTPGFTAYATPGLNGYVPADACNALWNYSPNFAAAVAFSVLFGMVTIAHLAQAIVYRNGFCWVIVMAAVWETGAYAFRALGSKAQQSSAIATVSQILVLVAPIWVNAFAYMVFARIVHFYSPTRKVWLFSPSLLALIFVTLDIVSFIVQLIGGGMAGPGANPAAQRKGTNIYMGGIGMQEGFILLFSGLVIKFHRDQLQAERMGRLTVQKSTGWRWLIVALYACLLAITIRIIYRLVEFSAGLGKNNPLPGNETLLYILESIPMTLAMLVWTIVHPGRFMCGEDAKLPPSWLFRHLCCCCRKRRAGGSLAGNGAQHHRLTDEVELAANEETRPIATYNRDRATASPTNPFLDTASRPASPIHNTRDQFRLRPSPAADNFYKSLRSKFY
ncbi:hypothetical protein B0A48_00729 [Cryoendolithus antarcticus]|uniref:RTA1 domain-containing protein n=1 Tax=Cryoendolithus antarcticus TaxID=1507870 RepID=A0A1V8TVI5_9PEZI|nr:hypothetical protein B0A48_00729 [Cryoendolithus antarcticus]